MFVLLTFIVISDKIRALEAQLEVEKKWYEKHARDAESKIETRNLPEDIIIMLFLHK